ETAAAHIYTLSLHDALPIFGLRHRSAPARARRQVDGARAVPGPRPRGDRTRGRRAGRDGAQPRGPGPAARLARGARRTLPAGLRSEEHTSELQSPYDLVCRL